MECTGWSSWIICAMYCLCARWRLRCTVDECRVFSGLRRPFDVGPAEVHPAGPAGCTPRGAKKRASDADENTLHSSPTEKK